LERTKAIYAVLIVIIIALSAVSVYEYTVIDELSKKKIDVVTLELGWTAYGRDANFYVSVDKGFYEEEGISMRVFRGYGHVQTAVDVAEGKYTFGISDIQQVILAREREAKVVAVGMMEGLGAEGLATLKETNIREPKDLERDDVVLGLSPGSAFNDIVPVFCELNGVDYDKLNIVSQSPGTVIASLFEGQIQGTHNYITSTNVTLAVTANETGKEVHTLWFNDYGIDTYKKMVICKETLIEENLDLVTRFLRATYKGVIYTHEHPDEAIEIFTKYITEQATGKGLVIAKLSLKAQIWTWDQEMTRLGNNKILYGWPLESKLESSRDLYCDIQNISRSDMPIDVIFIDKALPTEAP